MFSLCIPTWERFDSFLKHNVPKYLENELIDEIIISDENGSDVKKLNEFFKNDKIKTYVNSEQLGPLLNKLKACSYAKNEWIVLMDSDNFADENYFKVAKKYIEENITNEKNVILAPSFAKPEFNLTVYAGMVIKKGPIAQFKQVDKRRELLLNCGNYVVNKFLIDNINLVGEEENIKKSSACDVIYLNTLFFEQLDLNMHVVKGLEYEHVVHNGSIYVKTCSNYPHFNEIVHERYRKLNSY